MTTVGRRLEPHRVAGTRLREVAPALDALLCRGDPPSPQYEVTDIRIVQARVVMRDGTALATDLYLPPLDKAPSLVMRTPYGRNSDRNAATFLAFARRGYAVVAQDCRGTGGSDPDVWDYYMFEGQDGVDLVEWICEQLWYDGFIGSCGGSYPGQTQWCMALNSRMTTIVPEVSGLGLAANTAHAHMLINAYARSVGKGGSKVATHYTELERILKEETLAGGWFNQPIGLFLRDRLEVLVPEIKELTDHQARRFLWSHYCSLDSAARAEFVKRLFGIEAVTVVDVEALSDIFGPAVPHDAHTLPSIDPRQTLAALSAPPLMITGWYDWGVNDALATWSALQQCANSKVGEASRLIVTPAAHNVPGYHEGMGELSALQSNHRTHNQIGLLLRWYDSVRHARLPEWPKVIYYLMGANEWRTAPAWPPPDAQSLRLYLHRDGLLSPAESIEDEAAVHYVYDPLDPTPTVGGSVISTIYPPGSIDVRGVQSRTDVLTFTTPPLEQDLDIVGPIRLILYVSSDAPDTDFVGRLSDVFPDGRAIQLQNGILRARFREPDSEPSLLEPGKVYRLDIDMWATANRFRKGHCLRLDISSADFPRFDRNSNCGGADKPPTPARQTVWLDRNHTSHLRLSLFSRGQDSALHEPAPM